MEEILIKAEKRRETGKGVARKLRKQGKIPAILYGKDISPLPISVSVKDWESLKHRIKSTSILTLEVQGNGETDKRPVILKEIQRDFLNSEILHMDFLQISLERRLEVEVPIVLVGESKGVEKGGIVEQHLRTIMVECLPTHIPDKIQIDISNLEIGDSIHVEEVTIPGVKLLEHPEVAIVTIIPPEAEEEKKESEEKAEEA